MKYTVRVDRMIVGSFGAWALWAALGRGWVLAVLFWLLVGMASVDERPGVS